MALLRLSLTATAFVAASLFLAPASSRAQPNDDFGSFEKLRSHHAKLAFTATVTYLDRHPDAIDRSEAYRFLFETALAEDLARPAKSHALQFLKEDAEAPLALKSLARRVAMTSLALEGDATPALDLLDEELAAHRRLDPSRAIAAATLLAAAVQRGDHPEAAAEVYSRLKRAFFLNSGVEAVVGNRLARLELLGQPAPEFSAEDANGDPVNRADFAGKVVLVDFWATNCVPCLEELPQLRQLYADLHNSGFEIIGVSLDEDEEVFGEFLARASLPWRTVLSSADDDATREAYHVETIPANFLIGPGGSVVRVDLHGHDLRAEVERLLKDAEGRKEP